MAVYHRGGICALRLPFDLSRRIWAQIPRAQYEINRPAGSASQAGRTRLRRPYWIVIDHASVAVTSNM